jgi:predicted Zn-dependent protease
MRKFVVAISVLLVLGALGFRVARPAYRHWKEERFVARAQQALLDGDPRAAVLSARQALEVNPSNVEACRIMARINEAVGSPASLQWRQKVLQLQPDSVTNRLDLARCAIVQGDIALASKTLQGIDKTNRNTAAFHDLAAIIAVGLNNIGVAEAHFTEALRFEPANKRLQLNQAVLRLQARDPQVVAGALKTLEQLSADPVYHKDALRHLAMAASRNKDYEKAVALTRELQSDPKAPLDDQLLHLATLKDGGNPEFNAYLAALESKGATNSIAASKISAWLIAHDMVPEAAHWLDALPPDIKTNRPVRLARADCCIAQNDWSTLQTTLEEQKWDDVDFLRHAMLARAAREQKQEFASQSAWLAAVRLAADRPKAMAVLVSLAGKWGWEKEREDALWIIVGKFPAEHWALDSLIKRYLSDGNTRGLQKVYSQRVSYDADDVAALNNLAAVSLLLNFQTARAAEMALLAYTRQPDNELVASTYAYALSVQGRNKEALAVLEALNPGQLERPAVALYYGAVLVASDKSDEARKYLAIAETAHLLPEEKALLEDLKKRVTAPAIAN